MPMSPPGWVGHLQTEDTEIFRRIISVGIHPLNDRQYRHWDTLRHLEPPEGLTHEQWWAGVTYARRQILHDLPLRNVQGVPFRHGLPDAAYEMLHQVDQRASGHIAISEEVTNLETRSQYLVSSLIEEAISSSQLEGASTTRKVAKEMLQTGRPPRDRSEQMILNNFRAMQFVRESHREPLTPELVFEIHRLVTEDALDNPDAAGRLQRPDEDRVKIWWDGRLLLHTPPPADELPARLDAMCEFANGQTLDSFLHPVVRAILLHFWVGYDHPFEDGNGRTARAIFYWAMLNQGYWLAEFPTISTIVKKAPVRYAKAYLYTETDGGDTTYFVLNQLKVLCRAIDSLHDYLRRKMHEVREVEAIVKRASGMNHRQLALVGGALRDTATGYTFRGHATTHNVTWQSARTDLLDLEARGLLQRTKRGRMYVFYPRSDITDRLRALSEP